MADGNDNGIQLTYKGPIEHLDNLIPMLNPQQAQAAAGGLPAMPSAPPPPAAAPPALGRTTLGMVQPMPAVEMGTPSMPGGQAPRTLLGKVGHGLGIAGEIAGTAFAPRLMPWVPGTEQYKMREEALGQQRQDEEAERALTGAKTELTEAQAKETGKPTEKPATEDWFPVSGTNLEIERHSGNTRPIEGMQQPQPKALPDRAQWVEDENGKVAYLPESVISTEPGKYK